MYLLKDIEKVMTLNETKTVTFVEEFEKVKTLN